MTINLIILFVIAPGSEKKSKNYDDALEKQHNALWHDRRHITLAGGDNHF